MNERIKQAFLDSSKIIEETIELSEKIENAIEIILESIKQRHKIVIFGNGGSAADAQHIAAEFIGRYKLERKSIPAISLTTDTSILTAISNDYSFDDCFSRQCESLINEGDVIIAISTSGNSKNVENGVNIAKKKGAKVIGLLGNNGGKISNLVDISLIVNSSSTPRIQEAHRIIYHIICEMVEEKSLEFLK